MEKVQFQLEATLPELKDLHEKGLFSRSEINQITKRRTQFESGLIKKGNRKEDFFRYAEYEVGLESLRRVRWKRLGYEKDPPPPSASTYSIPRRVMYILKRATAKYPADTATWLAYIEYAGRERMRKIVSKGLNNALQHHPLSSTLYLLSSFNHLHPGAPFPRSAIPSGSTLNIPPIPNRTTEDEENDASTYAIEGTQPARTTLLLGLRLLPKSQDLWREYIMLELGWVEVLRRRWKVLGVNAAPGTSGSTGTDAVQGGEGAFGEEGEEARRAILAGQLVLQAIKSALEGIPASDIPSGGEKSGMAFREDLLAIFRRYPSPLRSVCIETVYADLAEAAKGNDEKAGRARLVLLTRGLYDRVYDPAVKDVGGVVLDGVALVEEYGAIGKAVRSEAKCDSGSAFGELAGEWLDDRISECSDNVELRQYLLSILSSLAKPSLNPTPSLILRHLAHLDLDASSRSALIEKHVSRHPTNPHLQLLHLQTLLESDAPVEKKRLAAENAVKAVAIPHADVESDEAVQTLWTTWAEWETTVSPPSSSKEASAWQRILKLSLAPSGSSGPAISAIHSALLQRYYAHQTSSTSTHTTLALLHDIQSKYRPNPTFYSFVLSTLSPSSPPDMEIAKVAYEQWLRVCLNASDKVDAALSYADLLMRGKRGRDAGEVVRVAKSAVRGDGGEVARLEAGWAGICAEAELVEGDDEDDDSADEAGSEGRDDEDADHTDLGVEDDVDYDGRAV